MSAYNGPASSPDDSPVARARSLSRYALRLLNAEPDLLTAADVAVPLDRAGMLSRLGA